MHSIFNLILKYLLTYPSSSAIFFLLFCGRRPKSSAQMSSNERKKRITIKLIQVDQEGWLILTSEELNFTAFIYPH